MSVYFCRGRGGIRLADVKELFVVRRDEERS